MESPVYFLVSELPLTWAKENLILEDPLNVSRVNGIGQG